MDRHDDVIRFRSHHRRRSTSTSASGTTMIPLFYAMN
jgi:hypothetical protein